MTTPSITLEKRVFTLREAQDLLPLVRKITSSTVEQVHEMATRLEAVAESDPEFEEVSEAIDVIVRRWAEKLQKLGCEVKGLWLVDFDNGQGYYCWAYPEDELDHFHSYDQGFQSRVRIC